MGKYKSITLLIILGILLGSLNPAIELEIEQDFAVLSSISNQPTLRHCSMISNLSVTLVQEFFSGEYIGICQITTPKQKQSSSSTRSNTGQQKPKQPSKPLDFAVNSAIAGSAVIPTTISSDAPSNSLCALMNSCDIRVNSAMHNLLIIQSFLCLLIISLFLILPRSKIDENAITSLIRKIRHPIPPSGIGFFIGGLTQ